MAEIKYGSKKHIWSGEFIAYMNFIVSHPTYKGMPDAVDEEHKIQWEAPSNRTSGKYKDTHVKRLDWWKKKAQKVGIEVGSEHWISKVAKKIHPTGKKPCKRCGNEMLIGYFYPQARLLKKINDIPFIDDHFEVDDFIPITDIVKNLYKKHGEKVLPYLANTIKNTSIQFTGKTLSFELFDKWLNEFIKSEPKGSLSPGAMSNAPDRFDGFHSFNLCCRSKADTGRSKENLQSYTTDRRVFENWNQGNWIAADRLMGLVRTVLKKEPCKFHHPGPCDADHIGPISLGFCHRPKFQLLCSTCNSAKNNRMKLDDINILKADESSKEVVVSWHTIPAWDLIKTKIKTDSDALKASKMLRDYSYYPLEIFYRLLQEGKFLFLLELLELHYADLDVAFDGLSVQNSVTVFKKVHASKRETKYALVQKARRVRIAFTHLLEFIHKENRQVYRFKSWNASALDKTVATVVKKLEKTSPLDKQLQEIFEEITFDEINAGNFHLIERYLSEVEKFKSDFSQAKIEINKYLQDVANQLYKLWDSDRYTR